MYRWNNGCWAHTLVAYAGIEKHWGKDWRRQHNERKAQRLQQRARSQAEMHVREGAQ